MNIRDHNPECRGAAWQLQFKMKGKGKNKYRYSYRAVCLGCGKDTPVNETEAMNWNFAEDLIQVRIPN